MSGEIVDVIGRRVWDSRGRPTVEAEVHLGDGAWGRAIAPAGQSTGSGEALDRRDGGSAFAGLDVQGAVQSIEGEIRTSLMGRDPYDQVGIDHTLIDLDGSENKSRLGGNALIAVSMAVAHSAAAAHRLPLWKHLAGERTARLPLPEIQIFGGGVHANQRIDIQDYMVIATGAKTYGEALEMTANVYRAAGSLMAEANLLSGVADEGGFWPLFETNEAGLELVVRAIERAGYIPGDEVALSLDIAATEFCKDGRYRLACEDRELDRDGLIEMLLGWLDRYPIVSIEDPFAEDDEEGFRRFTEAAGPRVQIVGDDYLVTNASLVKHAQTVRAGNSVLIKPNQVGTLTETRQAFDAARSGGWGAILSARSGETEDVTIVHLAVGWGVDQLKVGSFARSERMAKWNEGLRIADAIGDGTLPRPSTFAWGQ